MLAWSEERSGREESEENEERLDREELSPASVVALSRSHHFFSPRLHLCEPNEVIDTLSGTHHA